MVATKVLLLLVIASYVLCASYSSTEALQIRDRHNAKRQSVNPLAGPTMANLTWDATLATYASNYAETLKSACNLVHSTGPYGENLAWTSYPLSVVDAGLWVR